MSAGHVYLSSRWIHFVRSPQARFIAAEKSHRGLLASEHGLQVNDAALAGSHLSPAALRLASPTAGLTLGPISCLDDQDAGFGLGIGLEVLLASQQLKS